MSYTIEYKPSSLEDLKQINRQIQSRIIKKITWLAKNFEEIEPLTLSANLAGAYKLRVGDYRIIYEFSKVDESVTILKIGHRSEIYG
jgi:mRNA interferase RelE/StbE